MIGTHRLCLLRVLLVGSDNLERVVGELPLH